MTPTDTLRFASRAATGYPLRTALMVLAMSIGVAAVVVLTALGDGARRYVVNEFASLGSNLVIVLPGRSETGGFNPANAITETPRDLTVEDAQALTRAPAVLRTAPLTVGTSEATYGGKLRDVTVVGASADYLKLRRMELAQGRFLPAEEPNAAVAVIGAKIQSDLFGIESAIGRVLRIGDRRFRVIGVLGQSGQGLGMNADEIVVLPVAVAQAMFNTNTLFRILVEAKNRALHRAGEGADAGNPQGAPRRRGGCHGHHAGRRARHLRPHPRHADLWRRRHRRHQPRRRRHPRHERDARRRDAAYRRDRPAEGTRRGRRGDPQCLPRRGGAALGHRRAWSATCSGRPAPSPCAPPCPPCRPIRPTGR